MGGAGDATPPGPKTEYAARMTSARSEAVNRELSALLAIVRDAEEQLVELRNRAAPLAASLATQFPEPLSSDDPELLKLHLSRARFPLLDFMLPTTLRLELSRRVSSQHTCCRCRKA